MTSWAWKRRFGMAAAGSGRVGRLRPSGDCCEGWAGTFFLFCFSFDDCGRVSV